MSGFNNVIFSRNHYTPHYSTPYRIERVTIHLKDLDTTATIYPIFNVNQAPVSLIQFLSQEYNDEILRGDTLPFFDKLSVEEFQNYWFGQFAAVMCIGDDPELSEEITVNEWAKRCLGSFFIKSAYPGRCSHICTTNFLVNAGIRRRGIGFYICECFLRWAPILGYSRCIVDLVFETNIGLKRLLEKCGFHKVGKVNSCAMLKSTKDVLINSFIFTKELTIFEDDANTSKHTNILTYLLSGQYPENSSKEDRSRLRALAYHYEVINSKLYLKGKEVVSDLDDQLRIIKEVHEQDHMGINKTTSLISAKYYWSKIKSTVKKVVDECDTCRQASDSKNTKRKRQRTAAYDGATGNDVGELHSIPTLSNQRNETESDGRQPDDARNTHSSDILLQQSENVLMNYINLPTNSTAYSSSSNYLPDLGYKEKITTTVNNNNSSSQDFASLINYYDASHSGRNLGRDKDELNGANLADIVESRQNNALSFEQANEFSVQNLRPSTSENLQSGQNVLNSTIHYNFNSNIVTRQNAEDDDEDDDDDYEYNGEAEEDDDDDEEDDEDNDGDDSVDRYDHTETDA